MGEIRVLSSGDGADVLSDETEELLALFCCSEDFVIQRNGDGRFPKQWQQFSL